MPYYFKSKSLHLQFDCKHRAYRSVGPTIIYLCAWLMQNDEVTDSDLSIVDDWIKRSLPRGRSPLPLMGLLRWLLSRKRILSKRVKTRAAKQMARFVNKRAEALELLMRLTVNHSEGSPRRVKNLEKIFPLLGLSPDDVHSELHRLMTAGSHGKRMGQSARSKRAEIDTSRLREMERNTREAQMMLSEIFVDDVPDAPTPAASTSNIRVSPLVALLQHLAERERWSRAEFDSACRELGLVPGAALENLNDLAYDTAGDVVVEEDADEIMVEIPVAMEILESANQENQQS